MVYTSQGEFSSNMSMYYANKLNKLFEGDINNKEIDNTLGEAFKDNSTKILLLKQQISDINSPQKSSNSINSQLEECQLYQFKLKKISKIRAFLIQAESENFKYLQRESKLSNVRKNMTTLSDDFQEITPPQGSNNVIDLYDEIYSKLFKKYCDIYKTIGQEKEERNGDNAKLRSVGFLPGFVHEHLLCHVTLPICTTIEKEERNRDITKLRSNISPSTVYGNLPSSVTFPSVKKYPSTQPRVRSGGIMPLIKYHKKVHESVKPLEGHYNQL